MNKRTDLIPAARIEQCIFLIRGHKAMLDRDLAVMYGVTTGNLNKAVKRNLDRFPEDFMFQLTPDEEADLIFQTLISSGKHGMSTIGRMLTMVAFVGNAAAKWRRRAPSLSSQ